jgi:chromosome segregation protein
VLSAIYIKGFKTFARPVRMPLSGGVTAIVGPNGSGKSNITDALLFALGEGSPSILRAGLMNDLIFSGSNSLPPASIAEVTLVLDNAKGDISLPYEEVSLTRRISRGGETEYRINGTRARLTDLRTIAGEVGLGRHSVLRQGAVDAIVSGGAAACRNALEEAAGLGVFRRRRLAAARKLERAADRLHSSRRLEAELSAQLQRIETEAVAAREYRELETRYRELSLAYLFRVATRDLDDVRQRLAHLESSASALSARQKSLREEGRRLGDEEKKIEGRVRAAEEAIRGLENGEEDLRAQALLAERTLLRLEGNLDRGTDRLRLVSRLQAELDGTNSKIRHLEEIIRGLEEEHSRSMEAFRRAEERVARGRAEHAAAVERQTRLSGKLRELRERREGVITRLRDADVLGGEELTRLEELGEELATYSPEGLRERSAALLGRLEQVRGAVAGRADEANRRRGVLAALVGRTEAEIRALRTVGENGNGNGKRLYEVLRPHPGYEAAVEAALGDLAGGVLVDTLGEGMRFLLGGGSVERVVVRLDAEGLPKNGTPPGKPLLDCVEILDASYSEALERLLDGAYVLERAEPAAPKSGYDVAVTRAGLRFTRTSASRCTRDGDFARQVRIGQEEERLNELNGRLGDRLYDLQEATLSASGRLDEQTARVEALASLSARTVRIARLLASETSRRATKASIAGERRSVDTAQVQKIESETSEIEDELCEARGNEERAKEKLNYAHSDVELKYAASRETAGSFARAQTELRSAREHQARVSRLLANLEGRVSNAGTTARLPRLAHRLVEHGRRLDEAARVRLVRLRLSRSETAGLQARAAERRAALAGEAGDLTGELTRATSEATALRGELSRAEEAVGAAETEIYEEWGATLEIARAADQALRETTQAGGDLERQRHSLARKLKNFGDVNLLAISQEGALRERHEFVSAQRADAEAAATEIECIIQGVEGEIEARFAATFREVRRTFRKIVPRMLEGAEGELELSEEGVEVGLKLRGRGWRPLRVLSGGERSLLALSFLFSIFLGRFGVSSGDRAEVFCMLDEAEAALDDINLARFLAVVDSYRAHGQFLLVTHQKRTMAAADVLYGVTPDASGATVVVSKRLTGD